MGSSPRMRGKHGLKLSLQALDGLIPAHAGKTACSPASVICFPAHPRACGENIFTPNNNEQMTGSSPRMRGKRERLQNTVNHAGLIPAHAGKTWCGRVCGCRVWAHPRACGENLALVNLAKGLGGSSPRMRGKPMGIRALDGRAGLIPAHAGKTWLERGRQ